MNFNKINIETWDRKKFYLQYMRDIPCTYSMCVNLEISKLMDLIKRHNLKFFPVFLYAITNVVNRHKEFRMAFESEGSLGYFDISNPCYTVFHKQSETFTNVWTKYDEDFHIFYKNYSSDMEQYKDNEQISKPVINNNLFNISCIPWVSFTGFNLNLQNGYDYLSPIFTIGKYFDHDSKILLPLAIQVHHAVCDGFHIAKFVNELQQLLDDFSL